MEMCDLNKRCVVYDRPKGEGNGILGTIIKVYDEYRFRLKTDPSSKYPNGNIYEFSTEGNNAVRVKFLEEY